MLEIILTKIKGAPLSPCWMRLISRYSMANFGKGLPPNSGVVAFWAIARSEFFVKNTGCNTVEPESVFASKNRTPSRETNAPLLTQSGEALSAETWMAMAG